MNAFIDILIYSCACAVYLGGAMAVYSTEFRGSSLAYPTNIAVAVAGSILWVTLTRRCDGPQQILVASLVWDALVGMCYMVPGLVLSRSLSAQQTLAIIAVLASVAWLKFAK